MCFLELQYCCMQQSHPAYYSQAGLSLMVYFQMNAKKTVILGFATCEIQYWAGKDLISPNPEGKHEAT